jgi:hypothetical protein
MVAPPAPVEAQRQAAIVPLSRESILGSSDLPIVPVEIPEWGGTVLLRSITAGERDRFEASVNNGKRQDLENFRARFAVLVLCDEVGNRLFADADAAALAKKSASALQTILSAGMEHNAMRADDVEALEKN